MLKVRKNVRCVRRQILYQRLKTTALRKESSYSSGGVDPFIWTNAYDFAPDDSESKMNAWDKITEFDPDQENVFFYWCNGKESYIVWNLKTAYKFDCATAEEFKKKVEEEYCTRVIQAIEP